MELNVAAKLRIMPKDVDVNLKNIEKEIASIANEIGKLHGSEIKPIAFGLNALEIAVLMNDARGGIDELEDKIRTMGGVSGVEVLEVTRL